MTDRPSPGRPTRRAVLPAVSGQRAAAALWSKAFAPEQPPSQQLGDASWRRPRRPDVHLAATDGWVSIADAGQMRRPSERPRPFWPDPLASAR